MRAIECLGDLDRGAEGFVDCESSTREALGKRLAHEVLHDEVIDPVLVADVVDRADVWMIQCRDRPRFVLKPRA